MLSLGDDLTCFKTIYILPAQSFGNNRVYLSQS